MNRSLTVDSPRLPLGVRARHALRRPDNWIQLAKFCTVGAVGYVINLGVYALLVRKAGMHYLGAASCSFAVAVTSNYVWNRIWTFRGERGHVAYQGMRFLAVSVVALGANLLVLRGLVALATPVNFLGNKMWSFSSGRARGRRTSAEGTFSEI